MPTKGNKGGRPQALLGRPFLKMVEFKLIYYDAIFTFSVGNAIEIFHLTPPPKSQKKTLHQLQESKGKKAQRGEEKAIAKVNEKETTRGRRRCSENSHITGEKKKRKKKKKRIPNPEKERNHKKKLEDNKKKKNQKKRKKDQAKEERTKQQ
ncbi:hypothetical protein PIB30_065908 [Stylosanthes scabra]|uniref:Uncharacterized protein n=1 Tax=Stylosanthes scabra TaxID=79078 RepID=A0ABU6RMN6_9FABA|nr:hypothetical protein [Stylosanthes scabra]